MSTEPQKPDNASESEKSYDPTAALEAAAAAPDAASVLESGPVSTPAPEPAVEQAEAPAERPDRPERPETPSARPDVPPGAAAAPAPKQLTPQQIKRQRIAAANRERRRQNYQLKKVLAPVCLCVALLCFIIGAVALLSMFKVVKLWPQPETGVATFDLVFLSAFPVGLICLFGGVIFFRDAKRYEVMEAAEREAAG